MKGDFSKLTFDPEKNFLRVLMQQGRVQLDSDWNEQAAILLHYMQTLAADLIGPYGGPEGHCGFNITETNPSSLNFNISQGRYYVDGILCENYAEDVSYLHQPDYFPDTNDPEQNLTDGDHYLVYLDVWERHITYLEDDDILEKALNGVDTTTRSKVVWQVKVEKPTNDTCDTCEKGVTLLKAKKTLSDVKLEVQINPGTPSTNPCCQHPDAKYRGTENQLYRIEIHDDGKKSGTPPTFKWSRDNGSIVFPVKKIDSDATNITVHLESLGRNDTLQLAKNDWVELVDDVSVLNQKVLPLYQVQEVDLITRTILLNGTPPDIDTSKHPLLRRWGSDEIKMNITATAANWIPIEAGIEVKFTSDATTLRTGDYWLIPARANNTLEDWNKMGGEPHGVEHHYAPLAIISVKNGIVLENPTPCKISFKTIVNLK